MIIAVVVVVATYKQHKSISSIERCYGSRWNILITLNELKVIAHKLKPVEWQKLDIFWLIRPSSSVNINKYEINLWFTKNQLWRRGMLLIALNGTYSQLLNEIRRVTGNDPQKLIVTNLGTLLSNPFNFIKELGITIDWTNTYFGRNIYIESFSSVFLWSLT
jgi:hypothetical protein